MDLNPSYITLSVFPSVREPKISCGALRAETAIANPPFNVRSWGADKINPKDPRLGIGYRRGQPTNSNANTIWMMHFLYHLAGGGTADYFMANGSMTTNITEEKAIREALVEEGFNVYYPP